MCLRFTFRFRCQFFTVRFLPIWWWVSVAKFRFGVFRLLSIRLIETVSNVSLINTELDASQQNSLRRFIERRRAFVLNSTANLLLFIKITLKIKYSKLSTQVLRLLLKLKDLMSIIFYLFKFRFAFFLFSMTFISGFHFRFNYWQSESTFSKIDTALIHTSCVCNKSTRKPRKWFVAKWYTGYLVASGIRLDISYLVSGTLISGESCYKYILLRSCSNPSFTQHLHALPGALKLRLVTVINFLHSHFSSHEG